MKPTESEIKKYELSSTDAENFFDLINLKPEDFETVYRTENGITNTYVKFNQKFSAQHVDLIMKVAKDQLQARIKRQKSWETMHGTEQSTLSENAIVSDTVLPTDIAFEMCTECFGQGVVPDHTGGTSANRICGTCHGSKQVLK